MNVTITDKRPSQRNGDEKTLCKKMKMSDALFTAKLLSVSAPFLKQRCVNVSRKSVAIRNKSILRVNFFSNIFIGI